MVGKFARGGAAHTKERLKLNLDADIGDGMILRDIFNTDAVGLYRSYARRVAGEVALAQYGVMGKKGLAELRKAAEISGASVDDMKAFDQISAEFLNAPFGDHNHVWMDNMRTLTGAARLGGMGFTQAAEYGNAIAALGVTRMFNTIGSFKRMSDEVMSLAKGKGSGNEILKDIDTLGGDIGLDDYYMTRAFDISDNDVHLYDAERLGVISKAIRATGHGMRIASFHRRIVAVQTRSMAEQIARKAMRFIKEGKEDKALADMGFTPDLVTAIRDNMDNMATFNAKGELTKLDLMKSGLSGHHVASMRDAIERGAGQIIQRTYIGETGKWAHDGLLKTLFQFRTFSLTSVEKQWGRNVMNYGAAMSFVTMVGAASFALPIYLARLQLNALGRSEADREKYLTENMTPMKMGRAVLNYVSVAGLAGDAADVAIGFGEDFGLVAKEDGLATGARGQGRGGLLGSVLAPSVGMTNDIWQGVHGNGKKFMSSMPGSRHPLIIPLVNGMTAD